jgi:hypothetical protein
MGLIGRILGMGGAAREIGAAVGGVAEVFVGNRAERDAAAEARLDTVVGEFGSEFTAGGSTWFDGLVDGLNRLPRPMLALSTLGLFAYSMAEPAGFALRMEGLALVPEPLWWLLGAIVSFYFGARELHYQRTRAGAAPSRAVPAAGVRAAAPVAEALAAAIPAVTATVVDRADPDFNAAVEEWRRLGG